MLIIQITLYPLNKWCVCCFPQKNSLA